MRNTTKLRLRGLWHDDDFFEIARSVESQAGSGRPTKKISKSDVVRAALEHFLDVEPAVPTGSLLEAVKPWVGCVEGPGDLSTNPRYLDDFGK